MYENLQDWNTHLQNTFVFLHTDSCVIPFNVGEVMGPEDLDSPEEYELNDLSLRGRLIYPNRAGNFQRSGSLTRRPVNYDRVEVGLPPIGYTNHEVTASLLSYNNVRQFRKSFNERLVRMHSPVLSELDHMGLFYNGRMGKEIVYNMINQNYTPYHEAIEEIRQGNMLGRAMSQTLAVCAKLRVPVPVIYYKNTPIGWVDDNNEINMSQSLSYLHEEIMQIPHLEEGMIRYE